MQRQSVPFVCNVFNDKTVAALESLKIVLDINDGTIIFVRLITDWFKIMNVKDRYLGRNLRDNYRSPWTLNCDSFLRLEEICNVISSCAWEGGKGRKLKLTKQTAEAFTESTMANVAAAKYLLTQKKFDYVLPAIFADEALEKFFGQARQRSGGNFYIDVIDIVGASKITNLKSLLKHGIKPDKELSNSCKCVPLSVEKKLEVLDELSLSDTKEFLKSNDPLKHKLIYISGHLVHKYGNNTYMEVEEDDLETVSSEFLDNLNRGGLSIPTLSTVFFVHTAYHIYENLQLHCSKHFAELLSSMNVPIAGSDGACSTLANIIMKAFVLNSSDKEKALGCLRRQEKLSN